MDHPAPIVSVSIIPSKSDEEAEEFAFYFCLSLIQSLYSNDMLVSESLNNSRAWGSVSVVAEKFASVIAKRPTSSVSIKWEAKFRQFIDYAKSQQNRILRQLFLKFSHLLINFT
jgi:hypothetical protein